MFTDYLYEYDNQVNVDESYNICDTNKFQVIHYLSGRCHLFALKLHEVLGLKVGLFIDDQCLDLDGDAALDHAFCYIDDKYVVDVRGIRLKEDLYSEFCMDAFDPICLDNSSSVINEWISLGKLCHFENKEEEISLVKYIQDMKENDLFSIKDSDEELPYDIYPACDPEKYSF